MTIATCYFDHNATSPPDPRVVEAMLPWLGARHGNPSSLHAAGQAARGAVELARRQVARLLGGRPEEIVFMGSGSEANNTVIASVAGGITGVCAAEGSRRRIVVAAFEHPSVLAAAERAERAGAEVVRVEPDSSGAVSADAIARAMGGDGECCLVAVMLANNEIGTIQPLPEIAEVCRERGALLLSDAVQAVGKVPVDVSDIGADFVVIAGHKFHGPIGVAALWVRTGVEVEPLLVGGGQERRRRASTENLPGIVGLGKAAEIAHQELDERAAHLRALQRRLEDGLLAANLGAHVHCTSSPRLPNTTSVRFDGVSAQDLLIRLDLAGFAVSTGSACASGAVEASTTLLALGLTEEEALATLRISCGLPNTPQEVDALLGALRDQVPALREQYAVRTGDGSGAANLSAAVTR